MLEAFSLSIVEAPQPIAPAIHWTAYSTAIAGPFIAVIAAWIAFRQWQLARNKLKLDLFDRRMAVYEAVRTMLGKATRAGKLTLEEEVEFLSGVQTAKWLFGPEVQTYLEKELWNKIVDFGYQNTMMASASGNQRAEHIKARTEIFKWIMSQYEQLDKLCKPYLTLRH